MSGVTLVAEGVAGRAVRLPDVGTVPGVVDVWQVDLSMPHLVHTEERMHLASQLLVVCVNVAAMQIERHWLLDLPVPATHGLALGMVSPDPAPTGEQMLRGSICYTEFTVDDDRAAVAVSRAAASCVVWGSVPVGTRGLRAAWAGCVAGAATAVRQRESRLKE